VLQHRIAERVPVLVCRFRTVPRERTAKKPLPY
jgi:hypothetical protein